MLPQNLGNVHHEWVNSVDIQDKRHLTNEYISAKHWSVYHNCKSSIRVKDGALKTSIYIIRCHGVLNRCACASAASHRSTNWCKETHVDTVWRTFYPYSLVHCRKSSEKDEHAAGWWVWQSQEVTNITTAHVISQHRTNLRCFSRD